MRVICSSLGARCSSMLFIRVWVLMPVVLWTWRLKVRVRVYMDIQNFGASADMLGGLASAASIRTAKLATGSLSLTSTLRIAKVDCA